MPLTSGRGFVMRATRRNRRRTIIIVAVIGAFTMPSLPAATGETHQQGRSAPSWVETALGATPGAGTGAGVTVALVSDGVMRSHPEFAGRVLSGWDTTIGRAYQGSSEPWANSLFGTFAAGLIAAADDHSGVTGIVPEARILPVRVESAWRSGDRYTAEGIDWAVDHGADVVAYVPGLTIARSTDTASQTCAAISRAHERGVPVFTPVVNDAASMDFFDVPFQPALCDHAVRVAGVDERFADALGAAPVAPADFAVPAMRLRSTSNLPGVGGYQSTDGSAFAGALGAAAAAAVIGALGHPSLGTLLQILDRASVDIGAPGHDPLTGAGVPYVAAALDDRNPPSATELQSRIRDVVTPRIVSVDAVDTESMQIGWEPPVGVEVSGYKITARFSELDRTVVVEQDVSSSQVRATFAIAPSRSPVFTVTADTSSGPRISAPASDSAVIHGRMRVTAHRAVNGVSASWGPQGVEVVISRTVAAANSAWVVDVLDALDGRRITSVSGSKHRSSLIVPFAGAAKERSKPVLVVARTGSRGEMALLGPQYPVALEVRVVKRIVLLTGTIDPVCRSVRVRACAENTVQIVDASTGRVYASSRTGHDGSFNTSFTCRKGLRSVVARLVSKEQSQPVKITCP